MYHNHARIALLVWLTVHPLKEDLKYYGVKHYIIQSHIQFKKLEHRHVTSKNVIFIHSRQDDCYWFMGWQCYLVIIKKYGEGVTGHSNLKYVDNESDDENNNEKKSDDNVVVVVISDLSPNNCGSSNSSKDDEESGELFSDSNVVIPIMKIKKQATKVNASNNALMNTNVLMYVSLPMSNKRSKNAGDVSVQVNLLSPRLLSSARNSQVGVVSCVDELMRPHSECSLESIKLQTSSTADGDERFDWIVVVGLNSNNICCFKFMFNTVGKNY